MLESVKNTMDNAQKTQLNEIQKFVSDIIAQVRELSLNLAQACWMISGYYPP